MHFPLHECQIGKGGEPGVGWLGKEFTGKGTGERERHRREGRVEKRWGGREGERGEREKQGG